MKTTWILLYLCLYLLSTPLSALGGSWTSLQDLPFLSSLEARDSETFYGTAPQSELLLLLNREGEILMQSHGAGTGLEGFRYPAEVDCRASMSLFVVEQDRVVRLDQGLNPLGSYNLLTDDFLTSPDLLARTATRELIVAESRTGHVMKVDASGLSTRLLDYSDLPRALHLGSMEVIGERIFLLDRPKDAKSHHFVQDLFNMQLAEFPVDSCLALHRDASGGLLFLFQKSTGLEMSRMLSMFDAPRSNASRSDASRAPKFAGLFALPPLPLNFAVRDFLLLDSTVLLLLENGHLFTCSVDRTSP
jgi:hypothetical protein